MRCQMRQINKQTNCRYDDLEDKSPGTTDMIKSSFMQHCMNLHTPCRCYSATQSCPTLCDPTDCSTPGFPDPTVSWSLFRLTSIESVMSSSHLILGHPLLHLPSGRAASFPASGPFPMSQLFFKCSVFHNKAFFVTHFCFIMSFLTFLFYLLQHIYPTAHHL